MDAFGTLITLIGNIIGEQKICCRGNSSVLLPFTELNSVAQLKYNASTPISQPFYSESLKLYENTVNMHANNLNSAKMHAYSMNANYCLLASAWCGYLTTEDVSMETTTPSDEGLIPMNIFLRTPECTIRTESNVRG